MSLEERPDVGRLRAFALAVLATANRLLNELEAAVTAMGTAREHAQHLQCQALAMFAMAEHLMILSARASEGRLDPGVLAALMSEVEAVLA
jgi:hypothetical protein